MKAVFADTFYWIALTNPADRHSQDVVQFDQLSWLRNRAVETEREILSDTTVRVIPQSHESFLSGFDLYATRPDKGYSLTDCISMQAMRREGLVEVLTNDRHFEQEGFRALFRDA